MKSLKIKFKAYFLILLYFIFCMNSCRLFLSDSIDKPHEIIVTSNYITIEWDNPVFFSKTNTIESYNIYFRKHGYYQWLFYSEVDYKRIPSFTFDSGDFTPGKYDFGVSAVTTDGRESKIHSSLDSSASPSTGWYIFWIMD